MDSEDNSLPSDITDPKYLCTFNLDSSTIPNNNRDLNPEQKC